MYECQPCGRFIQQNFVCHRAAQIVRIKSGEWDPSLGSATNRKLAPKIEMGQTARTRSKVSKPLTPSAKVASRSSEAQVLPKVKPAKAKPLRPSLLRCNPLLRVGLLLDCGCIPPGNRPAC